MLIQLIDSWAKALVTGKSVRIAFLDYTKAFDTINRHILLSKYQSANLHPILLKWLSAFLTNRTQCVKIGDVKSMQVHIKGSVPQGALLGMEAFCQMIEDLEILLDLYKYVGDSTTFDIINKSEQSDPLQCAIDQAVEWTKENDMVINVSKTH